MNNRLYDWAQCAYVCVDVRATETDRQVGVCERDTGREGVGERAYSLSLAHTLTHNAHLSCHLGIKVDSWMRVFGCAARLSIHTRVMTHKWMSMTHMWMSDGCTTKLPIPTWVMARISTSHVTNVDESWVRCQTVNTHRSNDTHNNEWWETCERITTHIRIRHRCDALQSIPTWVVSNTWMRHVTRVMTPIWMSYVTNMDESCPTFGWVMSHIWMSHVPHMDESGHTHGWVMSSCHTHG